MFERLFIVPQDPLLKLISEFNQDTRKQKIDLGVGVYRNENGATPVMNAVKIAEERLLTSQQSKSYLGIAGDLEFLDMIGYLVFGGIRPKKIQICVFTNPRWLCGLALRCRHYQTILPGINGLDWRSVMDKSYSDFYCGGPVC